jgi:hypothetical protein
VSEAPSFFAPISPEGDLNNSPIWGMGGYFTATVSISINAPMGSSLTANAALAG